MCWTITGMLCGAKPRLVTFDDAAETREMVSADYERHCRGARAIAEQYFDANRVLPSLLAAVGV